MAHGRYTIVGKLADGGMAEIFLATQHGAEGFEKPVVMKRVLTAFSADPQFRNMFIDEAHISMALAHGNIVQVLDVGLAGERMFLVLELVEGWDLEAILARAQATGPEHPWPPSLGLHVTAQICRGLAYAHAKRALDGRPLGIVHRDVNPTNVLISEQGEVKLADFGIAKAERKREQTAAGVIKGKVGFMSPEQSTGKILDARSDLFSVGTMLYLMLTGRKPFAAPSELESMLRSQRAEYRPPEELNPYLSPEATAIVNRAMRRDPAERYQTADEMLSDVERALRGQYNSAGQSELKTWLAELARRDGAAPMGRRAVGGVPENAGGSASDLSAGVSVELSDFGAGSAATTVVSANVPSEMAFVTGLRAPGGGGGAAVTGGAPSLPPPSSSAPPFVVPAPRALSPAPSPPPSVVPGPVAPSAPVPPAPFVPVASVRIKRKSRVGLGFFLGALCMLGAVFGIRWLAAWAGREGVVIPHVIERPRDGTAAHAPTIAGNVASNVASNEGRQRAPAGSAETTATADASGAEFKTASKGASKTSSDAAVAATGEPGAPSAVPAAPIALPDGAVREVVVAAERESPDASARAPDGAAGRETGPAVADEDEDALLGRVVPGASAVIGEDEADAPPPVATRKETHRPAAAPAQKAPRPPVLVRITSSPLGAVVRTKKQVLGRTPLAIRFNPGNTYQLTFVKAGYVTSSRMIAVAGGKPKSLSVPMKKAPPPPPPRRIGLFRGR